jgi:hypothetical protein
MNDQPARLLDCGLDYEEQGEEVHPHPECPIAVPAVQAPATDRAALREQVVQALYDARRPGLGGMTEAEAVAHMADAVLAVPTDRAASPGAFVLWLDASDGSVPTHDGIQWPDGTVTIHHRHFGITTTHHSAEAACQAAHGKQGRIVWPERAPTDRAAVLHEAADRITRQADELWAPGSRAHTVMYADAAELRRMADEAQPAEVRTDTTEWTFEACYDADNDKWHGVGGTYANRDQARADFENLKRTDTANRLTHYSPRLKVRLVRATTTYVVEAERDLADEAQQDGARS